MKARPFLAVLLAVVLVLLGLGLGGWWLVWRHGPLRLQHHALTLPHAARFVPRQAALSLYVLADGDEVVRYAKAVAPAKLRRRTAEGVERLRDGVFAAAGLDYQNELRNWLAPPVALALMEGSSGDPESGGWLLALGSRDRDGASHFLQRFWQTRSLAGTDLQVSQYRGIGVISGRGALVGTDPVPLATALVGDDLVLVASGREVLQRALDVSQIDELNQALQPGMASALESLQEGAALLVARPAGMNRWLDLPFGKAAEGSSLLIAAVKPEGSALRIDGWMDVRDLPASNESATLTSQLRIQEQALRDGLTGRPTSLALLHNPSSLREMPFLEPILEHLIGVLGVGSDGKAALLPSLVARSDAEAFLLADGPEGWQMGTPADQPKPGDLAEELATAGLTAAPLEVSDRTVTVWTRLEGPVGRGGRFQPSGDHLKASLAGWRRQEGELAWWGERLSVLGERKRGKPSRDLEDRLVDLGLATAPLQWVMAADAAGDLLQGWAPWQLLSAMAGGPLGDTVRGLAIGLSPAEGGLRLQALLDFQGTPAHRGHGRS